MLSTDLPNDKKVPTGEGYRLQTFNNILFHFPSLVQYVTHIYSFLKKWRHNRQWSLSCCLALILPLTSLQNEMLGMTGKNVLRQQLASGKFGKPTISGAFKDSGAADIELEENESSQREESDHGGVATDFEDATEENATTRVKVTVHEQTRLTNETTL